MQPSTNPYGNFAGLVDREIGTAYETVLAVSGKLEEIQHLSDNLQAVYLVAQSLDLMREFVENPDFLPFLLAHANEFGDLATLISGLTTDFPTLAGENQFTGFTALGDLAPGIKQVLLEGTTGAASTSVSLLHGLDPEKVVDIRLMVSGADLTRRPGGPAVEAWVNATHLVVQTAAPSVVGVTNLAGRPFTALITYVE